MNNLFYIIVPTFYLWLYYKVKQELKRIKTKNLVDPIGVVSELKKETLSQLQLNTPLSARALEMDEEEFKKSVLAVSQELKKTLEHLEMSHLLKIWGGN